MVEMLGVLSIIGVLSVGGISAYTTAMEKHKANELLHQASMLATTISAQAMTNNGTLPSTITSFGNTNYGTFSTSTTDALDGKGFTITISNMDSAVCTQMEKMAGEMVQGASCSGTTLTLTYYKNLATTQAEGEKSPTSAEPSTPETPQQDPCGQCTFDFGSWTCEGTTTDCTVCVHEYNTGGSCVLRATCNKVCDGECFDNYTGTDFAVCCSASSSTDKEGCPSS